MGDQAEGKWVVPNPQVPRTFGMMNLVFGILLVLMGAGYLALYIVMPRFQSQMVVKIKEQQDTLKANRAKQLAELKKKEVAAKAKEDAAKTKDDAQTAKEEAASIVEERETLESSVEPDLSAVTDMMGWNVLGDIRLAIYYFSEIGTGMVLNVLMAISGVGLLGLAEWARRLAIGVSWLKILRWVAMTIVTMVVVVPITTEKMDKMFKQIQVQANARPGGGPTKTPMIGLGQMTAVMSAIAVVFSAVVASIYPAISLWFLTRPPTRAACLQVAKPVLPRQGLETGDAL